MAGDPEPVCEVGNRAIDAIAEGVDSDRRVGHGRPLQFSLGAYATVASVRAVNERIEPLWEPRLTLGRIVTL
jgi:hypothetical protein